MIKKQAMAAGRQFGKTGLTTSVADLWWDDDITPRLDTGHAENQPSHPYWVKPHNYSIEQWHDIREWMNKTFGESDWAKTSRWVGGNRKFWFRDAADRTLFLLRWS